MPRRASPNVRLTVRGSFPLPVRKKHRRNETAQRTAAGAIESDALRAERESLASIGLLATLTFASGCTALIFQVAWMRELRLVFGATTASVAAVLAIFMAGLGFGSAILGKWADRVANPLRMYGILEAAIALSAAATPWLIGLITAIYVGLGGQESLGMAGATAVRLSLASLVMAVPTFLMGGTLPAAVRSVTRTSDANRRALGILYGSNTLGAVFGAFGTTFFALENLGTRATLWLGCALGLAVGMIAVLRSRRLDQAIRAGRPAETGSVPETADFDGDSSARFRRGLLYATAAVLGCTFFALELVWYRMLGPILGGTTFTFGLILCWALVGIGLGGIAYNSIFRRWKPSWPLLAITCGCEALFAIIPFALGDRLAMLAAWRSAAAASFGQLILGWSLVASIVVFPAALVSGIQFPLVIALLGQGRRAVSRHIGITYAWNTSGSIIGSLVAGFGGLPLLTAPGMWQLITLLLAALSLVIWIGAPRREWRGSIVVTGLLVATVACNFAQGPTAAWRHSGIGAGRAIVPPPSEPNRLQQWIHEERHTLVWEADGIESSVGIDAREGLAFIVNGKSDGNALSDAGTQTGVAIIGATVHQDPKNALVIGLGTGESAGWLAHMRQIEKVDVVELEPAIDEMAYRCRELNWDVLNNPRVRRIYNDGREHVLTTSDRYDVIISEPSNPYRAGIATLYTTEFYRALRRRLNPGGVFVQFLQAYEIDPATVDVVLATVGSEFAHVEVWQTLASDLQLVCSETPIQYSVDDLRERIESPGLKQALAQAWMVYDVEGFLAHFAANASWSRRLVQTPFQLLNTDDRTVLEYRFAKTVGRSVPFSIEQVRLELARTGGLRPQLDDPRVDWRAVELRRQQFNLLWDGQLSMAFLNDPQDQALVKAFFAYRNKDFAEALRLWPEKYLRPGDSILQLILAKCYADLGRPECLELLTSAESRHPTEAAGLRAIFHARRAEWTEAAQFFDTFYSRLAESPWVVPTIVDSAFARTLDVAKADAAAAQVMYGHLSKPFASSVFNFVRQLARILVAKQLNSERVVEALGEWEPNVPWTADVLPARAKAYTDTRNELAVRAERDWARFQRQQRTRAAAEK